MANSKIQWEVVTATLTVKKATESSVPTMLYFPYGEGGALIDDDVIVADVTFRASTPAARICGFRTVIDCVTLDKYLDDNKVPKRRLWSKAAPVGIYSFVQHDVPDEYRAKFARRLTTEPNFVSRLDTPYGQELLASIDTKDVEELRGYYNMIRGVEIGHISYSQFADVLKSVGEDRLNTLKSALGVKRLSVKTLYENLTAK